jgi:hypothetical protein
MYSCIDCGAEMIGDGSTSPYTCEYAQGDEVVEADGGPIYCGYEHEEPPHA